MCESHNSGSAAGNEDSCSHACPGCECRALSQDGVRLCVCRAVIRTSRGGRCRVPALSQKSNPSKAKQQLALTLPFSGATMHRHAPREVSAASALPAEQAVQNGGGRLYQCKVLCWCFAKSCGMAGAQCCGLTSCLSFLPGLPISTYAKYCYRKLQKVAVTGGKKVSCCPSAGGSGCLHGTRLSRSQRNPSCGAWRPLLIQ